MCAGWTGPEEAIAPMIPPRTKKPRMQNTTPPTTTPATVIRNCFKTLLRPGPNAGIYR
jgi:hypothetical protein